VFSELSFLPVALESEEQRKDHLRSRLHKEIRNQSLKYPHEPDTYDGFVAHMQKIEDNITSRWNARKSRSRKAKPFGGKARQSTLTDVDDAELGNKAS
jgi:hypothetical protein